MAGRISLCAPQQRLSDCKRIFDLSLARAAMQWTYVVGSRQRWAVSEKTARNQSAAAEDYLRKLGLDDKALRTIADAAVAEVSVDWSGQEHRGWAARIMPWEFLVAAATRSLRQGRPLTMVRHLNGAPARTQSERPFRRALFVKSEPGALEGEFFFDTERDIVRASLQATPGNWAEIDSPTPEMLRDKIVSFRPDIVHLAGFDTHQARLMLLESGDKEVAARFEEGLGRTSPVATISEMVLCSQDHTVSDLWLPKT